MGEIYYETSYLFTFCTILTTKGRVHTWKRTTRRRVRQVVCSTWGRLSGWLWRAESPSLYVVCSKPPWGLRVCFLLPRTFLVCNFSSCNQMKFYARTPSRGSKNCCKFKMIFWDTDGNREEKDRGENGGKALGQEGGSGIGSRAVL